MAERARVVRLAPRHVRRAGEQLREGERVAGLDSDGVEREGTVLDRERVPGEPYVGAQIWFADEGGEQHLVPVQWDDHEMVAASRLRRI